MPRKNSALLQKVSNLLKMKKPIIPKLIIFLKKSRKLKKFKLLKQHNYYNYATEYEFSPSSTPLIEFRRKPRNGRISFKKLYSNVLFISKCLGMESSGKKEIYCLEMGMEPLPCSDSAVGRELTTIDLSNSGSENECVDERAERFIQRFYEEMKRQRQESNFQLLEM